MNTNLFLSPQGRLDRRGFLIVGGGLFVAGLVSSLIPVVGTIAAVALAWPWVCVSVKRLHDMGRSGKLAVALMAVNVAVMLAGAVAASMAAAGAMASIAVIAAIGVVAVPMMLVSLGFLAWLALAPSQEGANRYGAAAEVVAFG